MIKKHLSKGFRISKLFLTIVLFTILPFVAFVLLTSKMEVAGIKSFSVQTGSMEPTVPTGSVIFVRRQPTYELNDIIEFKNKGGVSVTHRINQVIIKDGEFIYETKGDANKASDRELVSSKSIGGKEFFFVPIIGRVSEILKTPKGFIGLIILPILIFIGAELWNIKKELEKEIEKKIRAEMNLLS